MARRLKRLRVDVKVGKLNQSEWVLNSHGVDVRTGIWNIIKRSNYPTYATEPPIACDKLYMERVGVVIC